MDPELSNTKCDCCDGTGNEDTGMPPTSNKAKPRGLAGVSPERRREIASMGGKAAQRKGTGHHFTSEEAQAAGRKGGNAAALIPGHMKRIGTIGGKSRSRAKK